MTYQYLFKILIITSLCFFIAACGTKQVPPISFYYWKTQMTIGEEEAAVLDSLNCQKLYVRFFDVHWNPEKKISYPLAPLAWQHFDLGRTLEIIPVIYITNITLLKNDYDRGIDTLAASIAQKLSSMLQELDTLRFVVHELQLDCDWSGDTQAKYFRLIERLKVKLPQCSKFSATIRLHQVKYMTTTGVPPVDKGVLMFYNMGNIGQINEDNSILNLKTAQKYLGQLKSYPLPLDIALPVFAWGVQFRNKKIVQLLNDLSLADLKKSDNFAPIGSNTFKVLKSDYLKGHYIYKNDLIRIESIEEKELKQAVKMLRKAMSIKQKPEFIFYHLDPHILQKFPPSTLESLVQG